MAFAALIHGLSGVGKSPLLDTLPGPRLILDAEGGTEWTPSHKVYWDPAGPPPVGLSPDDTVVVMVRDFATMRRVYQWLTSPQGHEFKSVGFDSVTEIQLRCKDEIKVGGFDDQRQWGQLLDQMMALIRNFRDLKFHATHPVNVVLVALSEPRNGVLSADVQGKLGGKLPGYMDFVGYQFTAVGEAGLVRYLMVDQVPGYQAKDRTGRLLARYGQNIPLHGIDGTASLTDIAAVLNGQKEA